MIANGGGDEAIWRGNSERSLASIALLEINLCTSSKRQPPPTRLCEIQFVYIFPKARSTTERGE